MKNLKWNRKLSILVLIMFVTVSFASFNTNLFIDGKAYVRVDKDIRITNIRLLETEYNGYENTNSEYTNHSISTDVSLPRQASSLTYEVTVSNVSDRRYKISDIIEDSYDNRDVKYELIDASIGNIVEPHTEKTFKVKFTNNVTVVEEDDVYETKTYNYDYTGEIQEFIAPFDGTYTLEVWGASGGGANNDTIGYGGYSKGKINLKENEKLYVYVGGAGTTEFVTPDETKSLIKAGWNGGGSGYLTLSHSSYKTGSGGGSTDIRKIKASVNYKNNSYYSNHEQSLNSRIIVAGGGGGQGHDEVNPSPGGHAGGIVGNSSTSSWNDTHTHPSGGTQSAGTFGYGATPVMTATSTHLGLGSSSEYCSGGAGGGWYGGEASIYQNCRNFGGAGGSGYIGTSALYDKAMYCYNCQESNEESTKTISVDQVSENPESNKAKIGNGYAKITVTRKIEDGSEYDFDYTGGEQTFTAPYTGIYQLETWGAEGGYINITDNKEYDNSKGGYGGYSTGKIKLNMGTTMYINIGGQGEGKYRVAEGGYNGGGRAETQEETEPVSSGGGATHIASASGLLKVVNKEKLYIVSGGGGGAFAYRNNLSIGGSGGGMLGTPGTNTIEQYPDSQGGTQTSGGARSGWGTSGTYGKGGDGNSWSGGGGGGYYGGGGGFGVSGAGGSGYIGNSNLNEKYMYCYNCEESQEINTRTISTQSHSKMPKQNVAKEGNGYSRITLIKRTVNQTKLTLDFTFEEYVNGSEFTFGYTGAPQEFVVPKTGYYQIELWGASGNNHKNEYVEEHQVYGGYTSGKIKLNKGEILYIYVGGQSKRFNSTSANVGMVSGGATDIRLKSTTNWYDLESLSSRIMVAGGAGQVYGDGSAVAAGAAGGLNAYTILGNHQIVSPTQTSAGQGSTFNGANEFQYTGGNGSFGVGGTSANQRTGEGLISGYGYSCGAGGYYGGGGAPSGGSGNSFISGHNGCVAITAESDTTPRNDSNGVECANGTTDITCSKHYSDYVFSDTKMIDGKGYEWTTEVGTEVVGMPTHDGTSTMTGNDGDGFAKITCLEEITDYSFDYTGDVQEFVAPYNGIYKVELWGAQGGSLDGTTGLGGYTTGNIELSKNEKLYIAVGGEGESILTATGYENKGGYNGGGSSSFHEGMTNASKKYAGFGGGGATHISTKNRGELKNFSDNREEILMVAGGGGGDSRGNAEGVPVGAGGAGGGTISGHGLKVTGAALEPPENATQESGYAFGVGESLIQYTDSNNTGKYVSQNSLGNCGGGGGGGWYGGYTYHACRAPGASGGSGYIKSNLFTDYQMFCYQDCSGDNTTITEKYGHAKSEYANTGNGYARITLMEKFDTYKISYDLNGGTIKKSRKTYSTFDDNITLQKPTKEGYDFAGWVGGKNLIDESNYRESIEKDGITYTNNGDGSFSVSGTAEETVSIPLITLTNVMRDGVEYYLYSSFLYNGYTFNISIQLRKDGIKDWIYPGHPVIYEDGETAVLVFYIPKGYTVNAQNVRLMLTSEYDDTNYEAYDSTPQINRIISKGSKGNRLYHAVWTPKYNINYELDGGQLSDKTSIYSAVTNTITLNNPTKSEYRFAGWTGGKNLIIQRTNTWYDGTNNVFYTGNANANSVIAKVKPNTTYTVSRKNPGNRFVILTSNTMPDAGVRVKRSFIYNEDRITKYTFTTNSDENYILFGFYRADDSFGDLTSAEEEIQIEEGDVGTAYEAPILTPTKNITIPTGSTGNRTYTANWEEYVKLAYIYDAVYENNSNTQYKRYIESQDILEVDYCPGLTLQEYLDKDADVYLYVGHVWGVETDYVDIVKGIYNNGKNIILTGNDIGYKTVPFASGEISPHMELPITKSASNAITDKYNDTYTEYNDTRHIFKAPGADVWYTTEYEEQTYDIVGVYTNSTLGNKYGWSSFAFFPANGMFTDMARYFKYGF